MWVALARLSRAGGVAAAGGGAVSVPLGEVPVVDPIVAGIFLYFRVFGWWGALFLVLLFAAWVAAKLEDRQ